MALLMPPDWLWPVFLALMAAAVGLLAVTPDFRWRELGGWLAAARFAGGRGVWRRRRRSVAALLVWLLVPGQALALPRRAPGLWLMIMALYPLLSALPQELLFRVLFFRRYGALFRNRRLALVANAAAFALAHLMFWNWVAVALTFAGGTDFRPGLPSAAAGSRWRWCCTRWRE